MFATSLLRLLCYRLRLSIFRSLRQYVIILFPKGFHCFIICLLSHCSVLGFSCLFFFLFRHYPFSSIFPLFHYLFITSLLCSRLQLFLLPKFFYLLRHNILFLQGFHCFIICLLSHCCVLGFSCLLLCLLRHHTISSSFHCFLRCLLHHCSVLGC